MTIRRYAVAAFAGVFIAAACGAGRGNPPPGTQVTLEHPPDGAEVERTEVVKGRVSDPSVPVHVLVHPLLTNLWYVQRLPAPPNRDGSWQTLVYFGTEREGVGEKFEVVAIAGGARLEEGEMLERLPTDGVRSDIVTVKRK